LWDFAGSTVVHSVGGWAALAGALLLGPRLGKYRPNGEVRPVFGHNMSTAALGVFVLWFGWFGFNPGSTMAAQPAVIGRILMVTNLSGAMASLTATATAWIVLGKPDLSMILNGCLAGLVAITAPCAFVSAGSAAAIGAVAGVAVVLAVLMFDRLRIDDPVGALSVHLVNGIFGTLAVGLFAQDAILPGTTGNGLLFGGGWGLLGRQALGVVAVAAYAFGASLAAWTIISAGLGLRVSADEELRGLDLGEHGMEAYSGFQVFTTQ